MAMVRILVDGHNLIHAWQEYDRSRGRRDRLPRNGHSLDGGWPRQSAAVREELIRRLTLYQDAIGTPITVFFDGGGAPSGTPAASSSREMEVLYSRAGKTADELIERATHRFSAYGEVVAVTDDNAERETVTSLGGSACSCENFIRAIENALTEITDDIKHYNRREQLRFQQRK